MKKQSAKKSNVSKDVKTLCDSLKMKQDDVMKLAKLEKELLTLKANKESAKCKVKRQSMRNMKFFRHEHTAETIASLQRIASSLQ
jgi:hypothetical protein